MNKAKLINSNFVYGAPPHDHPLEFPPVQRPVLRSFVPAFDIQAFLDQQVGAPLARAYGEAIFSQGDTSNAVFFICKGRVRISVVSTQGKEVVLAVLPAGAFFGEACLAEQRIRAATAIAIQPSLITRVEQKLMARLMHESLEFAEAFTGGLLLHSIRLEEDLVDQLFNSCEKRLARQLLLLANYGHDVQPETSIGRISQEVLGEMVGTTRSRISFFMNRFRKLGFIEYSDNSPEIKIHAALLSVILHD